MVSLRCSQQQHPIVRRSRLWQWGQHVGFSWGWRKKYPGILGRERNRCPNPTTFLSECSGAQEALPVSSHFIIAFPGQMGPSLAFSGDGCEVEVAGPAPALWHAAEAGSWQRESQGEGPTPPYPCPSASAASSKLLQMGIGISFSSSSLSLAGGATQSPCSRCHLLGCNCTWHSNILVLL